MAKAFSIERIDLAWGHVEAVGVKLKNPAGKEVIKVDSLYVSADFMGLLKKEYVVSSITLKNPYIFVEVDKKGDIINPVLPVEPKPKKAKNQDEQEKPVAPVTVKKIEITGGAIDYLDRKTPATPVLTKIRNIHLEMKDIHTPFTDTFSQYVLSANMPGTYEYRRREKQRKNKSENKRYGMQDTDTSTGFNGPATVFSEGQHQQQSEKDFLTLI